MVCTIEFFKRDITGLFPENGTEYEGFKGSLWFFIVYNVMMTVRSLIHLCTPDSGLSLIAGIDLTVEGGNNISHFGS